MNLDEINARFRSGNAIPVERAYVRKTEWDEIYRVLTRLRVQNTGVVKHPLRRIHLDNGDSRIACMHIAVPAHWHRTANPAAVTCVCCKFFLMPEESAQRRRAE